MDEQQRIVVIGSPGAGKSTLAIALAIATALPLIHLDAEYWQAGWAEPDKADWQARMITMAAGERWVIDGNHGGSLAVRLARATLVVWLDLPTRSCLSGVVRRRWRYRGGDRPDMAAGCPERFDAAWLVFLWYVATFRRTKRSEIVRQLAAAGLPVVQLTATRDRSRLLTRLSAAGLAWVQGMARRTSSSMDTP